jgi:hypothetical protein
MSRCWYVYWGSSLLFFGRFSKGFPAAVTVAAQLPGSEALSTIVSYSRVLLCAKYSCFRTTSTNKEYQLILFLSQVEELELSKIKAMDLLKAHDGDAGKALRAYIAPVA